MSTKNMRPGAIPYLGVDDMIAIVRTKTIRRFIAELASYLEEDFKRWREFDKTARTASHSPDGVIELMPTSDGQLFSFKYVNGHPKNAHAGLQTVVAFGALAEVATGYPILISEMTLLTALRTAASSALAAKYLARSNSKVMALIGNGAQSEFQALAFHELVGIEEVRLFDVDPAATEKCVANLADSGLRLVKCRSVVDAALGADIITTATADKRAATILGDNMVGAGVHLNAIGGDCPGKTELHENILKRAQIFVEFAPQTRIEGEIQQLPGDHPVTELWEVIAGASAGRRSDAQITLFDGVGFALEDFSALRYVRDVLSDMPDCRRLDIIAAPVEARNLYGMMAAQQAAAG